MDAATVHIEECAGGYMSCAVPRSNPEDNSNNNRSVKEWFVSSEGGVYKVLFYTHALPTADVVSD